MHTIILMGILRSFNILMCAVKLQEEGFNTATFSNNLIKKIYFYRTSHSSRAAFFLGGGCFI